LQLDVAIGELARVEAVQALTAEHDPDETRRQPLGALHLDQACRRGWTVALWLLRGGRHVTEVSDAR
jgi:hypothetical protein